MRAIALIASTCISLLAGPQAARGQEEAAREQEATARDMDGAGKRAGAVCDATGGTLTLEEVLAAAFANAPGLRGGEFAVQAAAGRARQASLFPNPSLEVEAAEVGVDRRWDEPGEFTVALRQELPLGSRLAAATEVENARGLAAGQDLVLARLEFAAAVTADYIRCAAAADAAAARAQDAATAEEVFQLTGARVDAGSAPPVLLDLARAELALARQEARSASLEAETLAKRVLARVGCDARTVRPVAGLHELPTARIPGDLSAALAGFRGTPYQRRADAELARRRAGVRLAEARGIPDLRLNAGFRSMAGFQENALVMGLELPLALFDRNQGEADAARAEHRQAAARAESWQRDWRAQVIDAHGAVTLAAARLGTLEVEVLPCARRALEAAQVAFGAGKIALAEVLDARRRVTRLRLEQIAAFEELHLAANALGLLLGEERGATATGGSR